jgi:hypothetical protein
MDNQTSGMKARVEQIHPVFAEVWGLRAENI